MRIKLFFVGALSLLMITPPFYATAQLSQGAFESLNAKTDVDVSVGDMTWLNLQNVFGINNTPPGLVRLSGSGTIRMKMYQCDTAVQAGKGLLMLDI